VVGGGEGGRDTWKQAQPPAHTSTPAPPPSTHPHPTQSPARTCSAAVGAPPRPDARRAGVHVDRVVGELDGVDLQAPARVGGRQRAQHGVARVPRHDRAVLEAEEAAGGGALDGVLLRELGLDEALGVRALGGGAALDGVELAAVPKHQDVQAVDVKLLAHACVLWTDGGAWPVLEGQA